MTSITLLLVALKEQLLLVFHPSYSQPSHFILILAVGALVSCALGLACNLVAITGHARWNLHAGLVSAAVAIGLNLALIPAWGL